MKKVKRGKLIVLEGIDGSGKATQTKLLIKRLKKEGYRIKKTDFPRYGKKSAFFAEKYLKGAYGNSKEVGPYTASLFFALDRYDARQEMQDWLDKGNIILSNRYVSSNKAHQAGKIKSKAKRNIFLFWLDYVEHNLLKIPKEDIIIYLKVPSKIAKKYADKRAEKNKTKADIHEKDISHLKNAEKVYLELAKNNKWVVISCVKGNKMLPREEIHEKIWSRIKGRLK